MIYHVCRVPQNSDLHEGALFLCVLEGGGGGTVSICGNKGHQSTVLVEERAVSLRARFFYLFLCCYPRGPHGRLQ